MSTSFFLLTIEEDIPSLTLVAVVVGRAGEWGLRVVVVVCGREVGRRPGRSKSGCVSRIGLIVVIS